jgi:hypothetical protein
VVEGAGAEGAEIEGRREKSRGAEGLEKEWWKEQEQREQK